MHGQGHLPGRGNHSIPGNHNSYAASWQSKKSTPVPRFVSAALWLYRTDLDSDLGENKNSGILKEKIVLPPPN